MYLPGEIGTGSKGENWLLKFVSVQVGISGF
jgi:hypothetical protein